MTISKGRPYFLPSIINSISENSFCGAGLENFAVTSQMLVFRSFFAKFMLSARKNTFIYKIIKKSPNIKIGYHY
ncbi:unnamed protein product [Blepharisma stoltei]|uniref:Uncharacterized protein n=1 Tax=Blepharisma stoltei TaxID=1481888 RepID=A0AAU9IDY3_9CILI|nr:unnamed protein product [Blepharisma stoltei]